MQEQYYITHIGDCRLYELKEEISCLTADQTLASLESMGGSYGTEKYRSKRSSSILIQGLGASEKIRPVYHSGSLKKIRYIFCAVMDSVIRSVRRNFWKNFLLKS